MKYPILLILLFLSSLSYAKTVTFNLDFNLTIENATSNFSIITEEQFNNSFANTTSDSHGNGSVRLNADAVLIMNFDVNGTISGNITDSSGNNHIGELNNGVFWNESNGKYGSAYVFDGTDDYINISDSNSLDLTGPFTISAWVYWKAGGTSNSFIVYKEGSPTAYGLTICANGGCGGGDGRIDLSMNKGAGWEVHRSDGVINQNVWTHVAGIYDTSNNQVRLYINGVLDKTFNDETGSVQTNDGSLSIGRESTQLSEYFSGMIDEIKIYNRSLSAAEILALNNSNTSGKYYSSGTYKSSTLIANTNVTWNNATARISVNSSSVDTTQLVGWWKFNETTGLTVYDASGYGNNGTMTNSPTRSENAIADYAMKFDGVNDYISITDNPSLTLSTFTISFWFKPHATINPSDANPHEIFAKGTSYTIGTANSDGRVEVRGPTPRPVSTRDNWNTGQWYHLGLTLDGSGYKLYINGVQEGSSVDTTSILSSSNAVTLGGDASSVWFNGTIDEVTVWNRSLSQTEIFENYRRGLTRQGGNITLQISTSTDNATWSASSSVLLQDNTTTSLSVASGQYMNYTLNFNTNDTAATPYLFNISFSYSNISTTNINNVIRVNESFYNSSSISGINVFTPLKKFISNHNNESVMGFVFAGGTFLDLSIINSSSTTKLFQIRQKDDNNRVLLAYTKGNWTSVDSKIDTVNEFRILSKTFGDFILNSQSKLDLFIVAEFLSNNLNSIRFGSGNNKMRIRDYGKTENRGNINITLVV